MNKAEARARQEGFVTTGIVVKEWKKDEILPKYDEMKALCSKYGSECRLILTVEYNQFRNRRERSAFWQVFVKYSDAHKQFLDEENKKRREAARRQSLIRLVRDNELSMDDLTFMVNYKSAMLIQEAVTASKSINDERR